MVTIFAIDAIRVNSETGRTDPNWLTRHPQVVGRLL